MGQQVCAGATLKCSMGNAPSSLGVLPANQTFAGGAPAANIMDNKPMVNVLPFGMCMSTANPTVASATAAALGVLTPMPCVPMTTAPWTPGVATVMIGNMPAVNNSCKLMCNWGGVIEVVNAGQTTVMD